MDPLRLPGPPARHAVRRPPPLLVGAFLVLLVTMVPASFEVARQALGAVSRATAGSPHPALPDDAAGAPLGSPAPAPEGTGGYRFLGTEDDGSGLPVRWDPCRPIHYVVRAEDAPPGGAAAVEAAIEQIETLTGLRFVLDGGTTEAPQADRPTMDPDRYGRRWSPVLVAWTDPEEYPALAGYAGLGGPDAVSGARPGTRRYVTGVVLLNHRHLRDVVTWPQGRARMQAVVLHEFGHLVGLDHVPDENQLMFRRPTALPGGMGDGDRRGLARMAGGPCFRDF